MEEWQNLKDGDAVVYDCPDIDAVFHGTLINVNVEEDEADLNDCLGGSMSPVTLSGCEKISPTVLAMLNYYQTTLNKIKELISLEDA